MTTEWTEAALHQAARQMTRGLAAALPTEETAPSPALTEKLILLSRRAARGQAWRRLGQRVAAIALTAALALGMVLATSTQARAAVGKWLFRLTDSRAIYQFLAPGEASGTAADYTPRQLPDGCTLARDLTGADGTRTVLYTSPQGDLLFKCFPLPGDGRTLEIRASSVTDMAGEPVDRLPEALTPAETTVHGMTAHFYRFPENTARYGQEGYLLAFYDDGMPRYSVTLPVCSTALVWIDEDAGSVFLFTGSLEQDVLVEIADSIYENGGDAA